MGIRESNANRVLQNGNTDSDRVKNSTKQMLLRKYSSTASLEKVTFNDDITIVDLWFVQDRSENANDTKTILRFDGSLSVGTIIHNGVKQWLITKAEQISDIYWKGTIQECNNTLRFYNKNCISSQYKTPDGYYAVPCIFSDSSIDLEEGRFVNLPSGHYMVIIPSGVITKSDLNLRFILNDAAYKIVGINNATNGLVKIEIVDDNFTTNDNRELGIADWKQNQNIREIAILNGESSTLLYFSATLQLNVQCKENGVIVNSPILTYESSDIQVCTVSDTGLISAKATGSSIITVKFNNVSDTIIIYSDMSVLNNYSVVVTPTDSTINSGKSKIFVASVMNNGVEDLTQNVIWTLTNKDDTQNNYCTMVSNNKTCTLTASNQYNAINKILILRAFVEVDTTKFIEKEITIKGVI